VLAWRFVLAVVGSGLRTTWIILRPGPSPRSGFAVYRFAPLGETGTVLLAAMVTLTPGSTVIDIDVTAGEFRLHLLDAVNKQAALRQIREEFEEPLRVLLGAKDAPC
jgi:multisubunit Na+/H+ antiporter MnhE subunit